MINSKTFISVGVFFIPLLFSFSIWFSTIIQEDVLIWNEYEHLTYSDFRMESVPKTDTLAMSYCGVHYEIDKFDDYALVKVTANFYRSKSWIRINTPIVLNHEQGHFDLCELTARKIRRDLLKYDNRVNRDSFAEFVEQVVSNLEEENNYNQTLYEVSLNSSKEQEYFDKMIDEELLILSAFKMHEIKLYYLKK